MPQSTSSVRTADDKLVVEAPTAEAALEAVAEHLGTRAKIANVERVRRGGVGGFFARELVQVTAIDAPEATAAPPSDDDRAPAVPASNGSPAEPGRRSAVDALLRKIADRDDPFAHALTRQLAGAASDGQDPEPTGIPEQPLRLHDVGRGPAQRTGAEAAWRMASPQTASPAVGVDHDQPLPGTPRWSVANLARLGLPPLLSPADVGGLSPADDVAWTHALAARLRRLCSPLPPGPTIVVGPHAERLAAPLDLGMCRPGEPAPPESFVAPLCDHLSERQWLASVRRTRALHLVVGGPNWRGLLFEEPAVLSWIDDESMCEALNLAFQLGVALGYICPASVHPARANPVDIAMVIRRMLPTHP